MSEYSIGITPELKFAKIAGNRNEWFQTLQTLMAKHGQLTTLNEALMLEIQPKISQN